MYASFEDGSGILSDVCSSVIINSLS